jgi:hypothetical protein
MLLKTLCSKGKKFASSAVSQTKLQTHSYLRTLISAKNMFFLKKKQKQKSEDAVEDIHAFNRKQFLKTYSSPMKKTGNLNLFAFF